MTSWPRLAGLLALALLGVVFASGCIAQQQPEGWGSAAVIGEDVYMPTREGRIVRVRQGTDTEEILAINPSNDQKLGHIYGDLAVRNGLLYVTSYDGKVITFDLARGSVSGSQDFTTRAPVVSDPALTGSRFVVATSELKTGALPGGFVYGLAADGLSRQWQSSITVNEAWSGIVVDGTAAYLPSLDRSIYRIDLESGATLPIFTGPAAFAAKAAIANGVLYVGALDRRFYAVRIGNAEPLWTFDDARNWYWGRAVVDGQRVYAANLDGTVYALDLQTGEKRWETSVGGQASADLLLANGRLIVGTENGQVLALDPATGAVQWQKALEPNAKVRQTPQAVDGRLYIGAVREGKMQLYVFDQDGQLRWSHTTRAS